MKKAVLLLVAALAAIVTFAGISAANAESVYNGRFDHPSNIIRGGTLTKSEFTTRYRENKTKDLPAIFGHYGINTNKINEAKEGVVHANGNVVVGGKVVAKNAWSVGRQTLGSKQARAVKINGKTYYEKPLAQAISPYKAVTAFVFFDSKGQYKSAFLKACGNPITATPTPPPAPPKPPAPKPAAQCKMLEAVITNRDSYRLNAQATVSNGAKISAYNYVIKDASGKTVLSRTVSTTGTSSSISGKLPAGNYTATVTVKTSVGDRTAKACQANITIKEEEKPPVKDIKVCELATKKVITIKETAFDSSKHSKNLDDCKEVVKEIEVCELETKKVIKIKENEFDSSKHSRDLDDCKEEEKPPVKDIEVCVLETKEYPVTIKEDEFDENIHSMDAEDCEEEEPPVTPEEPEEPPVTPEEPPVTPEEPETPQELPKTGLANAVAGFIGLGSVAASASYYVASRRGLIDVIFNK